MSELVADCLRCGSNRITFDLVSAITTGIDHGWKKYYETFCICRNCKRSTTFVLSDTLEADHDAVHRTGLVKIEGSVNPYVDIEGRITLKDNSSVEPPDHVPERVKAVFREGSTSMAVGCHNAAGTMFRLCIDLVTRSMLPDEEEEVEGLNRRTRRDLGLRLPWLFDNGHLPEALRELSTCVREDGNDGAHQGTLSRDDATDLLDFTTLLLERIFTEPERLKLAQARRNQRRQGDDA